MDQAGNLRNLLKNKISPPPALSGARVIAVTSGKGGVGKTNFSINLAISLQRKGLRVIVLDADLGLANIEILVGVSPKYSLLDTLTGRCTMEEAVQRLPNGLGFISGGSGLAELANAGEDMLHSMVEKLEILDEIADIILIDTGAGISNVVLKFVLASRECIVVCAPEPTSITDAYSLMKAISEKGEHIPDFKIVINRADDRKEGENIFKNLHKVAMQFLSLHVEHLGTIIYDSNVVKAVKQQKPCLLAYPNSPFSREVEKIGNMILDIPPVKTSGMKGFMKRLSNIFNN